MAPGVSFGRIAILCLTIIAMTSGCGDRMTAYERDQAKIAGGKDRLVADGAKVEMRSYPQGDAWVVDLSGKNLTNKTFEALSDLRNIVELDLSKSNFNDEFAPLINDTPIRGYLMKLNLSNTAATDRTLEMLTTTSLLNDLIVENTNITELAINEFKNRWPRVRIKK